jgi:hypothetical protein
MNGTIKKKTDRGYGFISATVDVSFSSTVTAWSVLASRSFEKETMSPLKQKTPTKDRPPLTSSVSDRLRPVD